MSRKARVLAVWASLLAASWATWWLRFPSDPATAVEEARAAGLAAALVPAARMVGGDPVLDPGTPAPLAWRVEGDLDGGAVPVLLLHGCPGSHRDFDRILEAGLGDRPVIAPDLPGFGASRRHGPFGDDLPSHAVAAQARVVLDLLDRLGVARVHAVGYSMGGGVLLELWRLAPERIASATLLCSIGAQEYELFGSYELNHLVHLLWLGATRAAVWGVPHFGAWDRPFLGPSCARTFVDTDQRRLRPLLAAFTPPTLVVHGRRDFLVAPEAAAETLRLVPQARARWYDDAGHFLPWTRPVEVAADVAAFLDAVEAGRAPDRAGAAPERVAAARAPFDPATLPPFHGFALGLVLLLLAAATLVSEDLTCIGAGLLVAADRLGFAPATAACFVGILVGDLGLYLAGRVLGPSALRRRPFRWVLRPGAVARARDAFARRGMTLVFASRFMPGLRLPTYFAAGAVGTGFWRFAGWFALAGLLWTPALVGLSTAVGGTVQERMAQLGAWGPWGALAVLLALFLLVRVVVPALTWRGRRLLLGAWKRRTRWEYWPRWLFYPPVVLIGVLLPALKRRSLARVTAVNPAIPTGGLVGESKGDVHDALDAAHARAVAAGADPERVARPATTLRLPSGEAEGRAAALEAWRCERGLHWPLVLKPDRGERGAGVAVVDDPGAARAWLRAHPEDALAQEYVPGVEYGVFWVCEPEAPSGRLISVARKELPEVEGDGRSTLERLVLAHPRHVAMAPFFLERLAERLDEVPAAGERVVLSPLGTHCRGATFYDAEDDATPELLAAVEALLGGCEGFSFGRLDLRAPSREDLRAGRGLVVLELNGLTSEAAHVYDPEAGLLAAWGTLIAQWRLAWRIADAWVARGARPATLGECWRAWRAARPPAVAEEACPPTPSGSTPAAPSAGN